MTNDQRTFAKDVAKHLDRRRIRRRMTVWGFVIALLVAAAMYVTCGRGFGIGGKGSGEGSGPGSGVAPADARPKRCTVRVTASGITVDGKAADRDAVVTACQTTGADVTITGDARQGDWCDLKKALDAANVPFYTRETVPCP